MMKRSWVCVIVTATVFSAGCARVAESSAGTSEASSSELTGSPVRESCDPNNPASYQQSRIEAEWANWFTSMSSLRAGVDLAVLATVQGRSGTERIGAKEGYPGTLATNFDLTVSQSLLSEENEIPSKIIVQQMGGQDDQACQRSEVADDPLMRTGEAFALFLEKRTDDTYIVHGGPSGRFTIEEGLVTAIAPNGVPVKAMPLADFEHLVAGS